MKKQLIESKYNSLNLHFTEDAWFNATEAAENFQRKPAHWLELDSTSSYIEALCDILNVGKSDIIKTKRGKNGGTWFHPRLAVPFARWLDDRFAVWCDQQIDMIVRGDHPHYDWKRARHIASATHKALAESLKLSRDIEGKETKAHHYSNEARLINFALTGKFQSIDRSQLNDNDLDLIAKLEIRDAIMIGKDFSYEKRKEELAKFVAQWRLDNTPTLTQVK